MRFNNALRNVTTKTTDTITCTRLSYFLTGIIKGFYQNGTSTVNFKITLMTNREINATRYSVWVLENKQQ